MNFWGLLSEAQAKVNKAVKLDEKTRLFSNGVTKPLPTDEHTLFFLFCNISEREREYELHDIFLPLIMQGSLTDSINFLHCNSLLGCNDSGRWTHHALLSPPIQPENELKWSSSGLCKETQYNLLSHQV